MITPDDELTGLRKHQQRKGLDIGKRALQAEIAGHSANAAPEYQAGLMSAIAILDNLIGTDVSMVGDLANNLLP